MLMPLIASVKLQHQQKLRFKLFYFEHQRNQIPLVTLAAMALKLASTRQIYSNTRPML